jgi:hypothetical protein
MNVWWVVAVAVGIALLVLGLLLGALRRRADDARQLLDRVRADLAVQRSALRRAAAPMKARRTNKPSAGRG